MAFFVRKLLFFSCLVALLLFQASCIPPSDGKSELIYEGEEVKNPFPKKPLKADYESIHNELIKKSCLSCHNSESPRISFETEIDLRENYEDIIFYTESGCDLGSCMPPLNSSGIPKKPVPTKEIISLFKKWISLENK